MKNKIKKLSALLCAVVVASLSCLSAFATHNPSTSIDISNMSRKETQEYVHGTTSTYRVDVDIPKSAIDNVVGFLDLKNNKIPARINTQGELEEVGTRLENIVNSANCDLSDIVYDVFIFGNDEIIYVNWIYYIKSDTAKFTMNNYNVDNYSFMFNEKCFCNRQPYAYDETTDTYKSQGGSFSNVDYQNVASGFWVLPKDYTCYYYSNNVGTPAFDENGENVYESPEPWKYSVIYEPVLSENMIDISEIKVTVLLDNLSKKYCLENRMQVDILPYVSIVSAKDDLKGSYDNAKAVIPTKSNYTDGFTLTAGNPATGGKHTGYFSFDRAYGNNVLYTLSEENNYSLTLTMPITSTPLISNTDYYFNVLGIQHNYLLTHTGGNTPYRHAFKYVYENGENELLDLEIMSAEKFTFSSVLKKTDNKNAVGEGGLIMSTTNSLNTNPSTVKPYSKGDYISFDEIDEYNESIKEDYYPNFNANLGFDTSSLDGLFGSATGFFDFLKKGFSIFPSFIWLLIAGFITVLIFLRVMGR